MNLNLIYDSDLYLGLYLDIYLKSDINVIYLDYDLHINIDLRLIFMRGLGVDLDLHIDFYGVLNLDNDHDLVTDYYLELCPDLD